MDPQKITELANLFRFNGDKILSSEFNLTLSGALLRALNDSFTLIADSVEIGDPQQFQVAKPINSKSPVFRDLQLVHDFVQKTTILCITHYPSEDYFTGNIDISKFRALRRLEIRKVNVRQIIGIQPLRGQLQELICMKSLQCVDDIITHCGGDNSNGFVWNELKIANFSYNNLQSVDTSLEFAQYLQHLNLRHNQLRSVEAVKWLPHLKHLDLSYNSLQFIPQFHADAYKRLQRLNLSNNFVEDLIGISKMDALTELDLSDNCLMDHTCLLPLSALMTLCNLNLYGNPLHFHPKHRLATAQYLHKNTATVKFLLDLEPLSKNEKAITGKHQLHHINSMNRFSTTKSSSASINSSSQATPGTQTPASSVGSLHSFKLSGNTNEVLTSGKKKSNKTRTVEIEDDVIAHPANDVKDSVVAVNDSEIVASTSSSKLKKKEKADLLTQSLLETAEVDHLEAKKNIEALREKYGAEWLQSNNAKMVHSVLGIESQNSPFSGSTEKETNISREIFNDYLGEFSEKAMQTQLKEPEIRTSTPLNESKNPFEDKKSLEPITPIKNTDVSIQSENSLYTSVDNIDNTATSEQKSLYTTAENVNSTDSNIAHQNVNEEENAKELALQNVYATAFEVEPEDSEPEDEETYIVYTKKSNAPIFLTLSNNFLREKDTNTHRTKAKWSLKILESCERLKADTICINFDTVKMDKKERIYTVEEGLCQDLEKKLRGILSKRDLSEMNQTIYRCVNCSCQFSRENKFKSSFNRHELRCPDCNSVFIAEIHETPKSIPKHDNSTLIEEKLSPADVVIVEDSPIATPIDVAKSSSNNAIQPQQSVDSIEAEAEAETSNSIGSANSLNESSSCSKISRNASFDSNQSVVGSTNSERDLDFNVNGESDVDIISNPSQSSIEVLDRMYSSDFEDRRISQQPNLETIDDNSYKQTYTDWQCKEPSTHSDSTIETNSNIQKDDVKANNETDSKENLGNQTTVSDNIVSTLGQHQLTESSSSGSVTDSICTAYARDKTRHHNDKMLTNSLLVNERNTSTTSAESNENEESVRKPLKNFYQTLFQSTNTLMSSSKKLIDTESNIKSGEKLPESAGKPVNRIVPYKFNYTDFNDIDHRLKLYFYQSKFEDSGEHFKWLVRGRIYNENTKLLHTGVVVMSTTRLYLMEAFAPENDDVTKWLRMIVSVSVDRLESIELLPWKIGCSFTVRDWGGFLLLLQDILRTDSLLLYFSNNSLPAQCELKYQPNDCILKRLSDAVNGEKIHMFAILNACEVSCDNAKRSFEVCGLLTTDSHLFLTTDKLQWLSVNMSFQASPDDFELKCCMKQLMSNLVEVESIGEHERAIHFLDETQNKSEIWRLNFETKENAECSLNAIDLAWQKLFGVSLFNA